MSPAPLRAERKAICVPSGFQAGHESSEALSPG